MRSPAKLADITHPSLTVTECDVFRFLLFSPNKQNLIWFNLSQDQLSSHLSGHDAVLSCLGFKPQKPAVTLVSNIQFKFWIWNLTNQRPREKKLEIYQRSKGSPHTFSLWVAGSNSPNNKPQLNQCKLIQKWPNDQGLPGSDSQPSGGDEQCRTQQTCPLPFLVRAFNNIFLFFPENNLGSQ